MALSYGGMSVGGVAVGARDLSQADVERIDRIPRAEALSVVAPELVGTVAVGGRRVLLMGADVRGPVQAEELVVGRRGRAAAERP